MIVVVDIGNTSTTFGLAGKTRVARIRRVPTAGTSERGAAAALKRMTGDRNIDGGAIASVVPDATGVWRRALRGLSGAPPLVLNHRLRLGVRVDYPRPETIGADRLANASAAVARYGSPVLVADFGTALTFDVVVQGGVYVGGVIAPGLPLMVDYLAERTALLPRIRIMGNSGVVGRSTEGAMRIGAQTGYRGMVREIVSSLESGLGIRFQLCATGGYARWALRGLDLPFRIDPDLTLYGLRRIYDLNGT